ncbi:uncharacterized protein C11orf86 homolog isoform X1 [Odocoileus virginianus]|uniref:Uncharacterized protein C11orf86 homolog isoform X1 n=1 Tax=Odocoileus virginianus TaxID=9874 RepID=A0ABM4HCB1_ODOVR
MGTGRRSRSLRGPWPSYGKLQEPWGRPSEGRLRRALSLRQGREKPRSSDGGPERLDTPGQERLPGSLGDTEQLIQTEQDGSQRWLRQYQQVEQHLKPTPQWKDLGSDLNPSSVFQKIRRRWESFVTSFPNVTLSRSASPQPPLGTTS